jgi:biopolymer transport protein ExbB
LYRYHVLLVNGYRFLYRAFVVIGKASGTSSVDAFVRKIQVSLNAGNIDAAAAECDKQKGSVANVIKSALKNTAKWKLNQP